MASQTAPRATTRHVDRRQQRVLTERAMPACRPSPRLACAYLASGIPDDVAGGIAADRAPHDGAPPHDRAAPHHVPTRRCSPDDRGRVRLGDDAARCGAPLERAISATARQAPDDVLRRASPTESWCTADRRSWSPRSASRPGSRPIASPVACERRPRSSAAHALAPGIRRPWLSRGCPRSVPRTSLWKMDRESAGAAKYRASSTAPAALTKPAPV